MTLDIKRKYGIMDSELLTPEQASQKYTAALEYIFEFYRNEFDEDKYMPIIRDGLEEKLNLLQFAVNYSSYNPFCSQADRAAMIMWATQAAFWLGYQEAKKPTVELSKNMMETLGEL